MKNCNNERGCTEIKWAPGDQRCVSLNGCENAAVDLGWEHYVSVATSKTYINSERFKESLINDFLLV